MTVRSRLFGEIFLTQEEKSGDAEELDRLAELHGILCDMVNDHIKRPPDRDRLEWRIENADMMYLQDKGLLDCACRQEEEIPFRFCIAGVPIDDVSYTPPEHEIWLMQYDGQKKIGHDWKCVDKFNLKDHWESWQEEES